MILTEIIECVLQGKNSEPTNKQFVSDDFSHVRQSDDAAAAARTVRSVPPRGARGGGRRRPVSDGHTYSSSGSGDGRLRPAETRPVRMTYDGNRQRLSSSEQSPMEV